MALRTYYGKRFNAVKLLPCCFHNWGRGEQSTFFVCEEWPFSPSNRFLIFHPWSNRLLLNPREITKDAKVLVCWGKGCCYGNNSFQVLTFSRIERLLYCCTEQQLQKHRNAYLIYPLNILEIQYPVNTNSAYTAQFEIDNFA